jgi:hypothetical protein
MTKRLAELTTTEAIKLIAATSFRVSGFIAAINAFSCAWHLKSYYDYALMRPPLTAYDRHMMFNYSFDALFDGVTALLMFFLSVGLARLVTRGLSASLQTDPRNAP